MRLIRSLLVPAAIITALGTMALAQQDVERVTVKFSDPSRPGKLRVHLTMGGITVKGANRNDVAIEARPRADTSRGFVGGRGRGAGRGRANSDAAPTTGLRRLTQSAGFTVEEENNELVVAGSFNQALDFHIQVPARTNLQLSAINDGDIVVDAVEGEHEINNVNGPVTLTKIAGSVVAHAVNGKVLVALTRVTPDKPMAFTSLNGVVDVTLPASTKAALKLRSDMGDVFTDFDLQLKPAAAAPIQDTRRSGGRFRLEVNNAISGAINGGGPEFELRTFTGNVYLRKGP